MGKKQCTLLVLFMILSAIPTSSFGMQNSQTDKEECISDIIEKGACIIQDNITFLYVNGTNYEMGYQHGFFLREKVQENLRAFLDYSWYPYDELLVIWNQMKPFVPIEYLDEMQGLADGADVLIDDIAAAYMVIVVGDLGGCFGIAAWGNATRDGELIHTRSFDQPMDIQDPITGTYVHENAVLVLRNPVNGYASLAPSVAGSMHGGGGINTQAIALGQQVCWSSDNTFQGIPALIRVQMVLDHASTLEEAVKILAENRTLGWNFIVSDATQRQGVAVEVSAHHVYFGADDDPTESIKPFWSMKDIVRRTNFFIDPVIAETQRDQYNPCGLIPFIKLVQRKDIFFAIWQSYKAVSEEFQQYYGSLNLSNTMTMFKDTYAGGTNRLLRFIIEEAEGTSFNRAWNIWTASPLKGDMLVSFAEKDSIAFDTKIHPFNLFDLLEEYRQS